jgi:hypothetical protein
MRGTSVDTSAGIASGLTGHPIAMAVVVTLAGALFFGAEGGGRGPVPPDATIGVTYAVAAAVC